MSVKKLFQIREDERVVSIYFIFSLKQKTQFYKIKVRQEELLKYNN